jgi:hypothetical protein
LDWLVSLGRDHTLFKMHDDSMVAAVATGLGIVGLVSIPAVFTVMLQLTTRQPRQDSYQDADGKATPESLAAYSAKLPKTLIVLFAALACSTGVATAVLTTLTIGQDTLFLENWLGAGASVSMPHTVNPPFQCPNTN